MNSCEIDFHMILLTLNLFVHCHKNGHFINFTCTWDTVSTHINILANIVKSACNRPLKAMTKNIFFYFFFTFLLGFHIVEF